MIGYMVVGDDDEPVPDLHPQIQLLLEAMTRIAAEPELSDFSMGPPTLAAIWPGFQLCYDLMRIDPETMLAMGRREGWEDDGLRPLAAELRRRGRV